MKINCTFRHCIVAVLFALGGTLQARPAGGYSSIDLADYVEADSIGAVAINENRDVAINCKVGGLSRAGYVNVDSMKLVWFESDGGGAVVVNDINSSSIAVGYRVDSDGVTRAYVWGNSGVAKRVEMPSGTTYSRANGINDEGDIVGEFSMGVSGRRLAFVVRKGVFQFTDIYRGASRLVDINNRGTAVGSAADDYFMPEHPLLFKDGVWSDLGAGFEDGRANSISDAGMIVGRVTVGNRRLAFQFSNGQRQLLSTLGTGIESEAFAINGNGLVVGVSQSVGKGLYRPFIYIGGVLFNLNTLLVVGDDARRESAADQNLIEAVSVNDDGDVVINGPGTSIGSTCYVLSVSDGSDYNGGIANISAWGLGSMAGVPLILGYVGDAIPQTLLTRGVGQGLSAITDGPVSGPPAISFFSNDGISVRTDLEWSNPDYSDLFTDLFARLGAFPLSPNGGDAAGIFQTLSRDSTMHIYANGQVGSRYLGELYLDSMAGSDWAPRNVSVRRVVSRDRPLSAGITVIGNGPVQVYVRVVGRSLEAFGVEKGVDSTTLSIHRTGALAADEIPAGKLIDIALLDETLGAFHQSNPENEISRICILDPGVYVFEVGTNDVELADVMIEFYIIR